MAAMDVHTVRKANIRRLAKECGSIKAFAEKVGTDAAYVSALLSETIQRNPGDQFMRRVEKAFDLQLGSLDFPEEASIGAALAIQALEPEQREQVLDFIRYKLESSGPAIAHDSAAATYLAMLKKRRKPKSS